MEINVLYQDGAVATIVVPKPQVNKILRTLLDTKPVRQVVTKVEVAPATMFIRFFTRDHVGNWFSNTRTVHESKIG